MWTCPNCKTEVEPEFDVCWSCGTSRDGESALEFDPESEGIIGSDEFAAETEARQKETFVTIATYWQPTEALVAQSRLEAEGFHVYLADEQTINMDWLLANAIGGIKLQVAEHDAPRAHQILATISQKREETDNRVIAQAVQEGVRTDLPVSSPTDEDESFERVTPQTANLLIDYAYRASVIGLFIFIVPVHPYSLYLLVRATKFPGEPDAQGERKFLIALCIDIAVIVFWWVPVILFLAIWLLPRLF